MSVLVAGQILTITRFAAGSYVNGLWVEGSSSQLTVSGTVQPVPGSILQTLPEGKRDRDMKLFICDSELFITNPDTGTSGDLVSIEGENWQVDSLQSWSNGILPHYEYILIRAKEGA
jgi:hypothetical protein